MNARPGTYHLTDREFNLLGIYAQATVPLGATEAGARAATPVKPEAAKQLLREMTELGWVTPPSRTGGRLITETGREEWAAESQRRGGESVTRTYTPRRRNISDAKYALLLTYGEADDWMTAREAWRLARLVHGMVYLTAVVHHQELEAAGLLRRQGNTYQRRITAKGHAVLLREEQRRQQKEMMA